MPLAAAGAMQIGQHRSSLLLFLLENRRQVRRDGEDSTAGDAVLFLCQ